MDFGKSLRYAIATVSLFWLVKLYELSAGFSLSHYGVFPRSFSHLTGILFFPFLHGNFQHLLSNTFPFLILMTSILFFYPRIAVRVLIVLYLFSGFGVWVLARPSYHIGASGMVYGFAAFLFFSGVFRRDARSLALALSVAVLYHGILYGLFPNGEKGISWEAHLIGAVIGAILAFYYRTSLADYPTEIQLNLPDTQDEATGFIPLENQYFKYQYREKIKNS